MTGYQGFALQAIPLSVTGDVTDTDEVAWSRNDSTPYIASPILVDGRLYMTKSRNAILTCVDAKTGEVYFENERLPGMGTLYASPVAADGRIYFSDRDGNVCVVKAGETLEVLATNSLGETIDASPAIVGDAMYIRGEQHLFCIAQD
jgi:outer membrane protein assembly factor BamB